MRRMCLLEVGCHAQLDNDGLNDGKVFGHSSGSIQCAKSSDSESNVVYILTNNDKDNSNVQSGEIGSDNVDRKRASNNEPSVTAAWARRGIVDLFFCQRCTSRRCV